MTTPRILDERAFAQTLLRLARVYRREVNRALAAHGISDAKAMPVLHIARAGGGMRQGVLAEEVGVEGPSMVRILDQLCQSGLVERRDDPTDKRAKTLHLTAEGKTLAGNVEDAIQVVRAHMLAGVDGADLAATLRTFAAFEAALDAAAGQGG
jgi:MarR family transcriptional regulator for hemolysin